MTHESIHLHSITSPSVIPFSPQEYSQFKYGSKSIARKFGKEMGIGLSTSLATDKQYVVLPAPYFFIPTATFALKDYVIATLNAKLIERGMKEPIHESKVVRKPGYMTDYGTMSEDQRKKVIGSESFYTDVKFLEGKTALLIDDIRVTGAHEERMCEMIERMDIQSECIFLYFAKIEGNMSPRIEDHLNLYSMKSLLDLDHIIKNDEFIFNTRNTKFMLCADNKEFRYFINYQRERFRETLYANALGNGYHKEKAFKKNIDYLKTLL